MSRRTRCSALLAAAALVLPLAVSAQAHDEHEPSFAQPTNGTATGPARAVSAMPGTASTEKLPDMDQIDPVRYSYKDAIVEHALVPSRNGHDTIWVDIIRPRTKPGVRVPTIMDASP